MHDGRSPDNLDPDPGPAHLAEPESAGDELFSLRSGLRILLFLAAAILVLSVLCWLVGGPEPQ